MALIGISGKIGSGLVNLKLNFLYLLYENNKYICLNRS